MSSPIEVPLHDEGDIEEINSIESSTPSLTRRHSSSWSDDNLFQGTPNKDSQVISPSGPLSTPTSLPSPQLPQNKLTLRERKRIIVSPCRPENLTKAMIKWVIDTQYLLHPFREDTECWFHPSPPPPLTTASGSLRPFGVIKRMFSWSDKFGKHSLSLNYGIVNKIINHTISKREVDGYINRQWHLSHLCGNWTCLNLAHTTVEEGRIKVERNTCFSHRSGCMHKPACMKELKVRLGIDGKINQGDQDLWGGKGDLWQTIRMGMVLDESGWEDGGVMDYPEDEVEG